MAGEAGYRDEPAGWASRCHSLTIDSGWKDVAEVALAWLEGKGF